MQLKRLVDRGLLVPRSRGIYEAAEPRITQHSSIIEVVTRVPKATICLLTALRLHGLTTQNPFEVWIMIDRKARRPSIDEIVAAAKVDRVANVMRPYLEALA